MAKMLIPCEPISLVSELNSLMENLWSRSANLDDSKVATSRWLPAVDIKEEAEQFLIFADLPGVEPKDIEISMENNILTIKGKREVMSKDTKASYHRVERLQGEFYRRFTLPDTADGEHINAKSKQGVLEINIPKKKIPQPRKIEIKVDE